MDKEYSSLLDTYRRMFSIVDAFHFNSQNTAAVFGEYIPIPEDSKVIPITHGGIIDCRKSKSFDEKVLRLGFIGSEAPYKGLFMLKEVLTRINKDYSVNSLVLNVYGGRTGVDDVIPNIIYKGIFSSDMMGQVFDDIDLLVVPSVCYETFSFVTLEALSYGTPVLVSDHVGAKDIVMKYNPSFVYHDAEDLYQIINQLVNDRTLLKDYHHNLMSDKWDYSLKEHASDIVEKLYV